MHANCHNPRIHACACGCFRKRIFTLLKKGDRKEKETDSSRVQHKTSTANTEVGGGVEFKLTNTFPRSASNSRTGKKFKSCKSLSKVTSLANEFVLAMRLPRPGQPPGRNPGYFAPCSSTDSSTLGTDVPNQHHPSHGHRTDMM